MKPEPAATYRVQLGPDFGFARAEEIVSYLADLGVSHLYTSPYLQAASGSAHGYDVVDPTRVNEELGGAEAHARMCGALREAGMGHMIDVVPNHMAVQGGQNPWWWDILENGLSSRYAGYFDVDWESSEERWPNKVLLPVLGGHYGRVLEGGQFRIEHTEGVFVLHYYDHSFPVDPSSLRELMSRAAEACGSEMLAFIAECHLRLLQPAVGTARRTTFRVHRDKAVLEGLLARVCREEAETSAALDAEVERLNGDPDAMDAVIDRQNYRPAYWRTASRDLGYRRFFDINGLAGLRVEDPEVFRESHALSLAWIRRGWVQGVRIDHPDGLKDPAEYFGRLREACPDTWIVAEKILESGEKLPRDWPIDGTTGYDFLNLVCGLFVDPAGQEGLDRAYAEFTGETVPYPALVRNCKRLVLTDLLGSELNRLVSLFVNICERHRRHRDYTRHELKEALLETAAAFPVYRTYVSAHRRIAGPEDERYTGAAVAAAMKERPDLDPELFLFLKELLLLRVEGPLEGELAMRFQQLTGPAMAKGVEDTVFYRYHRLAALNEVGGDPGRFGTSLKMFHKACGEARSERPLSLLASTTHDTKRSEDVRARIVLLSEIPDWWEEAVNRWTSRNGRYRGGGFPDRNTEYLLYQTLVGAWPISGERLSAYMEKAAREAKLHTSWTQPNEAYEAALRDFISAVLRDREFLDDMEDFVGALVQPGRINSLAQTLLKLTCPGVPDIYQGTELWDLSLVDPDNRRPVDFALRRRLLGREAGLSPEESLAGMDEGLPKLRVVRRALLLRRRRPGLFGPEGSYRPLHARGPGEAHVVAFVRGGAAVTVAPRLVLGLRNGWGDTEIGIPRGRWRNVLTEDAVEGGRTMLRDLLSRFPVALLEREEG